MKKMNKKIISTILTATLVFASLTGCGNSGQPSEAKETSKTVDATTAGETGANASTEEVEEGKNEIPADGLVVRLAELDFWRIAQEQGFLDEEFQGENITFEYSSFQGGAYINEAMAADSVDFGAMWEQPALTAVANNYPETIIATYGYSDTNAPLIVTTASGIETIADLKGAKIGVILGGSFHYTALKYLEQAGLSVDDVELINTTDPLTLLRSGDIDAAVTFSMYAQQVIDDGTCKQIAIGKDYGLMAVYALVGNNKFIEKYPNTTARLLKVLDKTIKYTAENTETALAGYADYVQQDYNTLINNYNASVYNLDLTQEDVDAMAQVEKFLEDYDLIQTHVNISDAVSTQYLTEAGVDVSGLTFPD